METSRPNYLMFLFSLGFTSIAIWVLTTPYPYLAVLILPSIIFLLFLINYPWIALFSILFMAPLDTYREMLNKSFTPPKLLGLFLLIVIFFRVILRLDYKVLAFRSHLWLWMITFLVINLISTFYSRYLATAIENDIKLLTAFCIVLFVLFFIDSQKIVKWLTVTIVLAVSLNAILTVVDYVTGADIFTTGGKTSIKRSIGAADDPNSLCSWLIFSFPFLFYWFFNSKSLYNRLFITGVFFIHALAVILTQSRGGTMMMLISCSLLFWKHRKHFRPIYLGIAMSVAVILATTIIISTPQGYWERQKSLFVVREDDTSLHRRFSYIFAAKDAFIESPVIGHGLGTFRDYFATTEYAQKFAIGRTTLDVGLRRVAHNTYLEVIVGSGLLGFIAFMGIIILTIKNFTLTSQYFRQQNNEEAASLYDAYRLAFILLLVYLMVISLPYNKYIWLCVGLSEVSRRLSEKRA